ncbi:VOC family protein [Modestobacter sp. SSW1-42]|uniref:VOC family protein n=1 Tax=Modestobacter sp. SSW1-42 TaxID=596372 RepID=UPI003986A143
MSAATRPHGTAAWLDLTTPDLDAAADFYSRLLAWDLEAAETPMGRYVTGSIDAGPVAGMMAAPPDATDTVPAWAVFFDVTDVDEVFDRARRLGGTGLQPPTRVPGGARIAVVGDPAGAVVGLLQSDGGTPMAWGVTGAVAWVECQSRDVEASEAFYADLLGWTRGGEVDGYRVLECGGEQVAGLMTMPAEVPAEAPSCWLAYFAVDDVGAACARAAELGGTVVVPPMTLQDTTFAVMTDPFGALFAVLGTSG